MQIAFTGAGADWQGYNGEGPFKGNAVKKGRLSWIDSFSTYNWVVCAGSGMKTIDDVNGNRANIGIPGSITEELSLWAFKLLGITPKDIQGGSTADAVEAIQNRRVDAWVKGSTNPDSAIVSLSATTPVSLLEFSDTHLAKLHSNRPYVGSYVIEAETHRGAPRIKTYGQYVGVILTSDIPQELQYKVIKAVYEHWNEFLAAFPQFKMFPDPLKMTAENAIIPLAAGTVQYLEEKGYTVPKEFCPPEYKKK